MKIEAKCLNCGTDMTQDVEFAAGDWSEGLPSKVAVWCSGCDTEMEFEVEWHIVLWDVRPKKQVELAVNC